MGEKLAPEAVLGRENSIAEEMGGARANFTSLKAAAEEALLSVDLNNLDSIERSTLYSLH